MIAENFIQFDSLFSEIKFDRFHVYPSEFINPGKSIKEEKSLKIKSKMIGNQIPEELGKQLDLDFEKGIYNATYKFNIDPQGEYHGYLIS